MQRVIVAQINEQLGERRGKRREGFRVHVAKFNKSGRESN
jgi:hypothetical protein